MRKGTSTTLYTPNPVTTIIESPWMDSIRASENITQLAFATITTTPISHDRAIIHPKSESESPSDYFVVVDRFNGTTTWNYQNIFRPTSSTYVKTTSTTVSGVATVATGNVIGNLTVGITPVNWLSSTYKLETPTGINTNSVKWNTTSPLGDAVGLEIFSVPSSDISVTKFDTSIGEYGLAGEVYCPVVMYTTPASTDRYRVTALLSRYTSTETAKVAAELPLTSGTGSGMHVTTQTTSDIIYAGNGQPSVFGAYSTDADIVFIRKLSDSTEITLFNGSYLTYSNDLSQTEQWANLSEKAVHLTANVRLAVVEYHMSASQTLTGTVFGTPV